MTREERAALMLEMYGEACTKAQAAKMLNCSGGTITNMIEDGRIEPACEGTRVDVRSIAEYIMAREQKNFDARQQKKSRRWAV